MSLFILAFSPGKRLQNFCWDLKIPCKENPNKQMHFRFAPFSFNLEFCTFWVKSWQPDLLLRISVIYSFIHKNIYWDLNYSAQAFLYRNGATIPFSTDFLLQQAFGSHPITSKVGGIRKQFFYLQKAFCTKF